MKLNEILKDFKSAKVYSDFPDLEIENLTKDSRVKVKNGLFFCLRGRNFDGHNFAEEAVKNGAVAIVTEKFMPKISCAQIVCSDVRLAYSYLAAAFYENPQKKLKIMGVVGTNGKTSVASIVRDILNAAEKPCASIGTLGVNSPLGKFDSALTTPDPENLFKILSTLYKSGIKYVVMEVSAHAIALRKVAAINYESMIFTNCTRDHLDYFTDFYGYRSVKKSAFNNRARFFIVNADDELGREIYSENPKKTLTYGVNEPCDVFAMEITESLNQTTFVLNAFDMVYALRTDLLGEFNVYNLLSAVCAAFLCGIKPEKIVKYIDKIPVVKGRMEEVASINGARIFVDYAHTPDGLNKSLSFLSAATKNYAYLLFGAGGNRDADKRPLMGKIAGEIADFTVITSDNPRDEDENGIICDIEKGIKEVTDKYIIIPDRKKALYYAIEKLSEGDALLVAGKGAETYQEVKGEKLYFSDEEEIKNIVKSLNSKR